MTALSQRLSAREMQRLLRFLTVGLSGTLIDFGLLTLLKILGMPTLPANTISVLTGVINNFTWNRLWTFPGARMAHWRGQIGQYVLISLVGLLMNNTLVLLLEPVFQPHFGSSGYLPAKVLATGVVVFWNYLANRFWTFRKFL